MPDCLLIYRVISCKDDASLLQEDLDRLYEWTKIWQLSFNITKCVLLRCTRSLSPYQCNYTLNKHIFATTDQNRYLEVLLDKRLSWSPHISSIASKASQTLNFLKRNLSKCSVTRKMDPPFLVPPGPNISKYLDPPDNLFQFC